MVSAVHTRPGRVRCGELVIVLQRRHALEMEHASMDLLDAEETAKAHTQCTRGCCGCSLRPLARVT